MRILMLAQWYWPVIGGEENHVRSLSAALAGRGHQVSVVTLAQPGQPAEDRDGDVRIHRVRATAQRLPGGHAPGSRQSAPPFPDPEASLALRAICREEAPDIVHAHNWMVHSVLAAGGRRRPKLVLTLHDYGLVCARKTLHYGGVTCWGPGPLKCLRCASAHYGPLKGCVAAAGVRGMRPLMRAAVSRFVPVSSAVAEGSALAELGLPFEVIPNFIPDHLADAAPEDSERLAALPADPYLLFVGGLTPIKGISVLLEAYRRLKSPPPLVLIGYRSSEPMPELENPPPGVSVLYDLPRPAVMAAWKRACLGVVPSVWADPCPTVAMEAMASGVPVVASAIGGLPDIVEDGRSGSLVRASDPLALATAIQSLLDDPGRREAMGRAALERVTSFRESTVVPRIEGLYRSLAGGRSAGRPNA